jgi:D-arabinose 1-dehydrogenase-like Zn-dependent alcohol dehydrogenase
MTTPHAGYVDIKVHLKNARTVLSPLRYDEIRIASFHCALVITFKAIDKAAITRMRGKTGVCRWLF